MSSAYIVRESRLRVESRHALSQSQQTSTGKNGQLIAKSVQIGPTLAPSQDLLDIVERCFSGDRVASRCVLAAGGYTGSACAAPWQAVPGTGRDGNLRGTKQGVKDHVSTINSPRRSSAPSRLPPYTCC